MTDTSREAVERPAYLIRKGGYYYGPDSRGYTTSAIQAGRYTLEEAQSISHPNGCEGPRDGMSFIHEDGVSDHDWVAYRALLTRAETAEARLAEVVEGITEIERLYYTEGRDASWRATHMNGVARDTIDRINAFRKCTGYSPDLAAGGDDCASCGRPYADHKSGGG